MLPEIPDAISSIDAYAARSDSDEQLVRILRELLHLIAKQKVQIDNLRATRPRSIHEDPPGIRLTP